jgi:hypothetical protein
MAGKDWTAQVAAAAGVAAGTGAAQLGLGYGLGVVVWPVIPTPDDSIWLGSLGWATWIAASATVFGAVIAARLPGGPAERPGGPWRFALAASAAVGALLTVALIALPARSAVRSDTFSPQTIAAGYAIIGILLGLAIAYWAVVSRPVAANLVATAAWLWTLAAAAIVVELTVHRSSATYLSSWQFAELDEGARYGTIYWPSALLTLLAAFLIGGIGAWTAVRRRDFGIGAAASGAVGPLLVAAAFLLLAPQLTGALGPLESAYLIAPYAVLAGLAGSALTVTIAQQSAIRRDQSEALASRPATGVATVPQQAADRTPTTARGRGRSAGRPTSPEQNADRPTTPRGRARGRAKSPEPADGSDGSATNGSGADRSNADRSGADGPGAETRGSNGPVAKAAPRSSVKAPPASPPVAKINPPRTSDNVESTQTAKSSAPRKATAPGRTTKATKPDPTLPPPAA